MSVVRNEYEIGENDPADALQKALVATSIQAHPYHWSTIGYRSDIEGVTTEKLREHYKTFFHPDNADAILVGDFDADTALALFDREFGAFPRAPRPIPQVITVEPPQEGERRVVVKRPGSSALVAARLSAARRVAPGLLRLRGARLGARRRASTHGSTRRSSSSGLATTVNADNYTLQRPVSAARRRDGRARQERTPKSRRR